MQRNVCNVDRGLTKRDVNLYSHIVRMENARSIPVRSSLSFAACLLRAESVKTTNVTDKDTNK